MKNSLIYPERKEKKKNLRGIVPSVVYTFRVLHSGGSLWCLVANLPKQELYFSAQTLCNSYNALK